MTTHDIVTATVCFIAAALYLNGIIGAAVFSALVAAPAFFYVGREHAQAEYRYIQSHGGKRDKCPWYCGFLPEAWNTKSILDFAVPCGISLVTGLIVLLDW